MFPYFRLLSIFLTFTVCTLLQHGAMAQTVSPMDVDEAIEACSGMPLDPVEGVWIYPDDNVTVMIAAKKTLRSSSLSAYTISVVQSDDCDMLPGDVIGEIEETPSSGIYRISLFTERKGYVLGKTESCLASLSKDSDALIIKGGNRKKLKLRLNINFSRLLPNFWRIVRLSASSGNSDTDSAPVGMVKIYPSYDGNGSSRRTPRYL